MYEKECPICNKMFYSQNRKKIYCSSLCRKRHDSLKSKEKYNKQKYLEYYKQHRIIKNCAICNKALPNGKQSYCMDCLLKEYLHGDTKRARHILECRGYDKATIQYELKQRGWI